MHKIIFAVAALSISLSALASPVSIEEPGPFLNLNDLNRFIRLNDSNPQFLFSKSENLKGGIRVDRYAYQSFDYYNINKDYPANYTEYAISSQNGKQIGFSKKQILMDCSNQNELVYTTNYMSSGKVTEYLTSQAKFDSKIASERLEACQALKSNASEKGFEPPVERVILTDYKKYLSGATKSNSSLVYSEKDDNPQFKVDYYVFKGKQPSRLLKNYPDVFRVYMLGYSPTEVRVLVVYNIHYNCKAKGDSIRNFREFGPTGFLKNAFTNKLENVYSSKFDEYKYCENK